MVWPPPKIEFFGAVKSFNQAPTTLYDLRSAGHGANCTWNGRPVPSRWKLRVISAKDPAFWAQMDGGEVFYKDTDLSHPLVVESSGWIGAINIVTTLQQTVLEPPWLVQGVKMRSSFSLASTFDPDKDFVSIPNFEINRNQYKATQGLFFHMSVSLGPIEFDWANIQLLPMPSEPPP